MSTPTHRPDLPSLHLTQAEMIEPAVRTALAAAGPGASALDLACNEGWFSQRLLAWGARRVVGIDTFDHNIRRASLLRDQLGISSDSLSFLTGDPLDLAPDQLGRFDVVLLLGLISGVERPFEVVQAAQRLTNRLCVIESQLTRQDRPIVHGDGSRNAYLQTAASFAARFEDRPEHPHPSTTEAVSLIPNRAGLEAMVRWAGFDDVVFLTARPDHDLQYVVGDRAIVAATVVGEPRGPMTGLEGAMTGLPLPPRTFRRRGTSPATNPRPSPKHVTFLSHTADADGGAEIALLEILTYLTDTNRVRPDAIIPDDGTMADVLTEHHIPYTIVPFTPWCDTRDLSWAEARSRNAMNIHAVADLVKHLRVTQTDVAFTNAIVAPWLAVSAAHVHTPHVWMLHEFGDIDHNYIFDYRYDEILTTIDRLSSGVIVNSKAVAEHVAKVISPGKITQIYYAMADNVSSPSPEIQDAPKDSGNFRCLILGRIVESKGQLDAVNAVCRSLATGTEVELLIVGPTRSQQYLAQIKSVITHYDLGGRVRLLGFCGEPRDYLLACDALVVCSRTEAFGRVTAEAMLAGKPVIGPSSGATPELIQSGHTGLLYEPGDIQGLTECICRLAREPALARKMGAAGRAWAERNLTHASSEEKIAKVIEQAEQVATNYALGEKFLDYIDQLENALTANIEQSARELEVLTRSRAWKIARGVAKGRKMVQRPAE